VLPSQTAAGTEASAAKKLTRTACFAPGLWVKTCACVSCVGVLLPSSTIACLLLDCPPPPPFRPQGSRRACAHPALVNCTPFTSSVYSRSEKGGSTMWEVVALSGLPLFTLDPTVESASSHERDVKGPVLFVLTCNCYSMVHVSDYMYELHSRMARSCVHSPFRLLDYDHYRLQF
jgi:hypothetical protein